MNREEYTQLMIDKSKTIAAKDLKKVEKFAKNLRSKIYLPPEKFADHIIMECFKNDGVRPEYFLDKTQTPSKILFNTSDQQIAFANRVAEYQEAEAVVKELSKHNKVNSVNNSNIVTFSNESMIFNPEYIDDYHIEYLKTESDKQMFVVAGEKPKALEFTDKYSLFHVKPTQNEISIVVKPDGKSKSNSKDDVSNVDVPEVEYPLQKSDTKVKSYQDYIDELIEKYEGRYSVEKLSKTGLKKRLFNAETGGSITIEKSVLGSTTLTAASGTKAVDLTMLFMNKKPKTLTQVPMPETEEDFANMIEAWKILKSDGFDLNTIKLDKEGIPQRYHVALAELTNPGFVISGEELNNDGTEPAKPENSFVVVNENPFEKDGETPEQPKNEGEKAKQVKNEGEAPQEPAQPKQQAQQNSNGNVDEFPLEYFDDDEKSKNTANQEQDFDPDFDDALVDAVNGIDPNSDEAVDLRAIQELEGETGTSPNNSKKTHQQQAKKAKLR
ncbi:hypothetical protein [Vibrio vulnificus]|uniref:hypothetical protein n=1 Tax=Vibrio vulnificus TaxID=672 RepID=UPI00188D178A|nr:hypothetical protein [Vibrio vulnificus]MBF4495499.1 hypothetical protein [Vibrio vulnificus]